MASARVAIRTRWRACAEGVARSRIGIWDVFECLDTVERLQIIVPKPPGMLYVVATPIGNLEDLSPRAKRILAEADVVLAEDTRHSGRLLAELGLSKTLISLHEHNEARRVPQVLERLRRGDDVALVCDAGTPLISDPGYRLLSKVREAGLSAAPVPGPCAAVAALSVAGLASDRFVFEGFLPERPGPRRARLHVLSGDPRTLILYEAPHRIQAALVDMVQILGPQRQATLARELTKRFETMYHGTLEALAARVAEDVDARRGEIVIVVEGCSGSGPAGSDELQRVLKVLMAELPLKQAVSLAVKLTGAPRNHAYRLAVDLSRDEDSPSEEDH